MGAHRCTETIIYIRRDAGAVTETAIPSPLGTSATRGKTSSQKETTILSSGAKKTEKWAGDYIIVAKVIDILF